MHQKKSVFVAKMDERNVELASSSVSMVDPDIETSLHTDVTKSLEGLETAEGLIKHNPVVVISKSTCPFCFELKRTLHTYGVNYVVAEIDRLPSMKSIQKDLKEKYSVSTVPLLFLNGELVGGCMKVKELEHTGEFQHQIFPFVTGDVPVEERLKRYTLLLFPETVNKHVVRATGLLTTLYCIFCVIFFEREGTKYAVLGLALDFLLRLVFGSGSSPVGMVGAAMATPFNPVLAAGPPKQFAALCGLCMSGLSATLLLSGQRLAGTIVVGALILPAGLEGIFDFCLGCWMFGIAISFNLISPAVYRPYLNIFPAKQWAHDFSTDSSVKYDPVPPTHVPVPGQTTPSPVDLIRKDRLETEYKLRDVHAKNITVDFFALPLTLAGIAMVFKFTADMGGDGITAWKTETVYHVLGVTSGVLFSLLALVQLYKAAAHPKKLLKEWHHPIFGNFYSAVTICVTMFGVLLYDNALTAGVTLVWLASVVQMSWTVLRVADVMYGRIGAEMITPAIMFTPLGNLMSALAFASYPTYNKAESGDVNYVFVARLWFAVGAMLGLVYFAVTVQKSMLDHHSDQRLRPLLWVWMAAFAIAGPAYLAVTEEREQAAAGRGVLYQSLFLFAMFLFAVNAIGLLRGFYTYVADMSIWLIPFASSALTLSAVQYYSLTDGEFTRLVAFFMISITCTTATVCGGYTLMWTVDLSLFRPRVKWGPVSFLKLTHEAFRYAFPKLLMQLDGLLECGANLNPAAVDLFLADLEACFMTYSEHGKHEEVVLFPALRRFHPGLSPALDEEHAEEHALLADMEALLEVFRTSSFSAEDMLDMLRGVKKILPDFTAHVLEHLRHEERTVTVVARKYLTVEMQREINNQVWELTPVAKWYTTLPYVLKNLPHPAWRVRFVRSFIWGQPDRAQELGLLCYRQLDSLDWEFLAQQVPEMVPRGVSGWVRQY